MIYCNLVGGLCNMFFQIAAVKSFSLQKKTDCSFPNLDTHLAYLNSDTTHNPNLTNAFEYNIFFSKLNKSIPDKPTQTFNFPFEYIDIELPDSDCYVQGFFQSEKYFSLHRKEILELFSLNTNLVEYLKKKYPFITRSVSTSIHVRRGDYLKFPDHHPVLSKEYYENSIEFLQNETEVFVVFSDDIDWCKNNFIGEKFFFVENEKDYMSLSLMAMCTNNIIANSSFSWWGAWLNKNINKKIVGPKLWFGPSITHNISDILPENWTKF